MRTNVTRVVQAVAVFVAIVGAGVTLTALIEGSTDGDASIAGGLPLLVALVAGTIAAANAAQRD
jgi:hypothetical protein